MLDITNQIVTRLKEGKRLSANEVVLLVNDYNTGPAISSHKVMDELFQLIKERKIYLVDDRTRLGFVFSGSEINL